MSDIKERLRAAEADVASCTGILLIEAADLLDECERVMTGVAYYSPEAEQMMAGTLAKLRGEQ